MSAYKNFKSFDAKLRIEAVLRSALAGLAAGGAAAFIAAFILWFFELNGVLISVAAFILVSSAAGCLFYFLLFRPTVKRNARRLDSYGLEERVITMVELEGQDSYIAERQRRDAIEKLQEFDASRIKFRFSKLAIVLLSVFVALFIGMTTVEGLSAMGKIPTGKEVWEKIFPPVPLDEYTVTYAAEKGGEINGEKEQVVYEGQSSERVVAVADDGYMFYAWSDGVTNPSRFESNVKNNISVSAIFVAVDDVESGDADEDKPDDVPGEGNSGGDEPGDNDSPGGKYVQTNQVIDGKTYYRDIYEEYYNRAMEYIQSGEAIPPEIRAVIEAYYNIIR